MLKEFTKFKIKRLNIIPFTFLSIFPLAFISSCDDRQDNLKIASVSADWFNAPFTLAINDAVQSGDIDISAIEFTSGLSSKTAVMSGAADVGLAALPPLLRDANVPSKIVILGCYMSSSEVLGLVSTRASDDILSGKIGIVEGTISEIFLSEYIRTIGKSYTELKDDLRIIGVRPPDAPLLLTNGSADTVVIWEPHLSRAKSESDLKAVITNIYAITICAIANKESLAQKRELIEQFETFIRKNVALLSVSDDGTIASLNKVLPPSSDVVVSDLKKVEFGYWQGQNWMEETLKKESETLFRAGFSKTLIDVERLIDDHSKLIEFRD